MSQGYSYPSRAHQIPEEEVRQLINVNYLGSVMLTQALLPDLMNLKDGGAIIFTSSLAGLTGVYGLSAYCGSKFAIRGYAESLAMGKTTQCGNFMIFLSLRFYVKSISENPEDLKLSFFPFLGL